MDLQKHHKPTFDNISPEKRVRILDTATKEFAFKGFENANMSTIAKKAGVSVGSLYKYFENKQDLFLTTIQYSIQSMEELLNVLAVSEEDVLVKVERIIREIQRSSKENATLIKLYNGMTAENNPRFASQFAYEMEAMTARIYRIAIEEGKNPATSGRISIQRSLRFCWIIFLCRCNFLTPATITKSVFGFMSATTSPNATTLWWSSV